MEYWNKILKPLGNGTKKNAVIKKGERQDSMITKLSIVVFFFHNLLFQIQLSLINVSVINC